MIYKEFVLKENGSLDGAKLTVYVQETSSPKLKIKKRPLILLCPGGAYAYTSSSAQTIGVTVAVPKYTVSFNVQGHGTAPAAQTVQKGGNAKDDIYNYTIGGLSKSRGNVVLMHDIKKTTANALERVIQTALDKGYKFKTLDSSVKCWHRVNN